MPTDDKIIVNEEATKVTAVHEARAVLQSARILEVDTEGISGAWRNDATGHSYDE